MRIPGMAMLMVGVLMGIVHGKHDERHLGRPEPLPPERHADTVSLSDRRILPRVTKANTTIPVQLPLPPTTTPTSPPPPAPTPLDLSISYSLSDSCLLHLTTLLTSCLPFSLLLTTSTTYSYLVSDSIDQHDYTVLNYLLAYVSDPQPSSEQCDAFMSKALSEISSKGNCGADLGRKSSSAVAVQAKNGVGNYKLMREAAGLVDPDTGVYCYLEAVASDRPDDLYLWGIPAGIATPWTSTPTCSKCAGYYSESLSSTATLNATLVSTAIETVNAACGLSFVNYNASVSGASSLVAFPGMMRIAALSTLLAVLCLIV